jgi:hypothetical protein
MRAFSRCSSVPAHLSAGGFTKASFVNVYKGFYLALYDKKQATQMAQHELQSKFIMVPFTVTSKIVDSEGIETFSPSSLADIYKFDKLANEVTRKNADHKLVFCGSANHRVQIKAAFLLGCHLIMTHHLTYIECVEKFSDLQELFNMYAPSHLNHVSIANCWQALQCAKQLGWIDFREFVADEIEDDSTSMIHMEEYLHYARYVVCHSFHPAVRERSHLARQRHQRRGRHPCPRQDHPLRGPRRPRRRHR